MATIPEALAIAIQHYRGGRLQTAEQVYRQILAVEPNHADAWHLLGVIAGQAGRNEAAVEYIGQAIRLRGDVAAFHSNLGNAFAAQGKFSEAVASFQEAVRLQPDFAVALSNLGNALREQGRLAEAEASLQQALRLQPDCAEAHYNLGLAWLTQGKLPDAQVSFEQAVRLRPDYAEAHYNLGNTLLQEGQLAEAATHFQQALRLKAHYAEAHHGLGIAFTQQGNLVEAVAHFQQTVRLKPDVAESHVILGVAYAGQKKFSEAVVSFQEAVRLQPDFAVAHSNLGNALREQGRLAEAEASLQQALRIQPDCAEAHYNLGLVFYGQGKLDEAVACYRRAVDLKPDYADAHNNLGNALKNQGKLDEAVACYRRALDLKSNYAVAYNDLSHAEVHSNLLFALQYRTGVTLAQLGEAHAEYDRRHAAPLQAFIVPHENVRDRHGGLRLGFVSPDLGWHPVGYFLVRVLENLDKEQVETVCYSDRTVKDDLTRRLQAAATQWRDVLGMSDQRLAKQIRADRIEILFDLAGHTAHNRLLVFARKPAPIQVTWAGYVGTTGLKAMDYLLADRFEVPPGAERHYQERVLRMPEGYVCYDPPLYAPPVAPLPALDRGHVTLGCFNNPAKITLQAVEVWAKILGRLPGARLVLKFKGCNSSAVAGRFADMFVAHQIDPGRLEFLGQSPHAELLAEYNRIDLALDPFPYNGGLTTCEALWLGVPVVTCPGETFAGRHSLSHLSNVGLTETIARDLDEYVELAVSLAGDLPRLAALRAGLRDRMAASPLCDGKRFATNLMSMLHDVWEQR